MKRKRFGERPSLIPFSGLETERARPRRKSRCQLGASFLILWLEAFTPRTHRCRGTSWA